MIAQNARPRRALLGLAAALTLFTGFAAAAPAQAKIELRIRLEPKVLRPDGLATLTIQATGDEIGSLGFTPSFSLDNLEIVSGPHRFEETSWDGRGLSRTFRLSWTLRPLGPGRGGVREGRLAIRGRRIVLEDREIQVAVDAPPPEGSVDPLAPGVPDPLHLLDRLLRGRPNDPREPEATDASAAPPVFLRAEISPLRPYVGQQVLYTVYLYSRRDIALVNPSQLPDFRGFWRQEVPLPERLPTEIVAINGVRYSRWPLQSQALFPLESGPKVIGRATWAVLAHVARDYYGLRQQQMQLTANPVVVDVQPLPPAPPTFAGAVGDLTVSAELRPRELRQGESALLELSVVGFGRLGGLDTPQIEAPEGVRIYPPEQSGADEIEGSTVRGQRTWKYLVVPTREGKFAIRPPEVTVFEPERGAYRTVRPGPFELAVAPVVRAAPIEPAAPSTPAAVAMLQNPTSDTQTASGRETGTRTPWLFGFAAGVAVAAGALGVRRVVRGRSERTSRLRPSSPPGSAPSGADHGDRAEQARLFAQRIRAAAEETRPRSVALAIEEAWRDHLTALLGQSPGAQPARWAAALSAAGADERLAQELAALADDLHYLRWAPELSAIDDLRREVIERSLTLAKQLA